MIETPGTGAPIALARDPSLLPPRLADAPGLVSWMAKGWQQDTPSSAVSPGAAAAAAAHRALLRAAHPGRVVAVASGQAPVRNNDCTYEFRAASDFLWLTGAEIENAVVVVHADPRADATVYLQPPAKPSQTEFFTDYHHGEAWVGSLPGLRQWQNELGIEARPLDELPQSLVPGWPAPGGVVGGGVDPDQARQTLALLRRVKDDWEIAELRAAVQHTVDGFAAVARELPAAVSLGPAGRGERWLQGTFDRHARWVGRGPGYSSIVAGGAHAATLHWTRCDGPVLPDQSVLLDLGVEVASGYTADITRTLPVTGRFDPAHRMAHDLVERAHRAGIAAVRPGRVFAEFHHAVMEVIATGLADWGLLPVSVDEALSPRGQHHRRWLLCGVGHHLGLDVHDCAASAWTEYHGAALEPRMVLTIEPGLYFHVNDQAAPPELRGVGVRVEDDLLVTDHGSEVLSAALPIDASGLERWASAHQ